MSITSADDKEVEIVEEKKLYPTRLRKREEEKAKCLAQGLKYEEPKKKVIYEPQDWARSIKKSLKYDKKKTKRIRNPSPSESEPESESDSEVELIEISDKEEGDWTRKAPKSKFMRIKSIKKVGTSNNKIEKPKSSPPKPKPPKDDEELKCQCGLVIKGHNNLHQHLVLEHPPPTIHHCTKCNQNTKGLRNNFLCRICSKFVLHMKEHMKEHYRDRATDKCMYECRLCYKIFKTVDEVMDHERRLHGTLGAKQVHQQPTGPAHIYMCEYCHEKFPKKRERDVHAGSHYEPILPLMWDKIITLHEGLCNSNVVSVDQCPFCMRTLGGGNSYRTHMVLAHLLEDPFEFTKELGIYEQFEELGLFPKTGIKQEQKDEAVEENKPLTMGAIPDLA